MKVRDSIKEFRLIPIDELEIIQGDLKNLEKDEYEKLKQSILEFGFTSPFHLWEPSPDDGFKLLDGTQRLRTLKTMRDVEKIELPPSFPCVILKAPDEQTARKILLTLTSQYGRMTDDGLSSFMIESGLDLAFLKEYTRFPEVKFDDILDSILADENQQELGNMRDKFLQPPFSVLNAREGEWQDRKRSWIALGIQSELGRGGGEMTASFKSQDKLSALRHQTKKIYTNGCENE